MTKLLLTRLGMVGCRGAVLGMVSQLVQLIWRGNLLDELLGWPGGGRRLDGDSTDGTDTLMPNGIAETGRRPEASTRVAVEWHHTRRLKHITNNHLSENRHSTKDL